MREMSEYEATLLVAALTPRERTLVRNATMSPGAVHRSCPEAGLLEDDQIDYREGETTLADLAEHMHLFRSNRVPVRVLIALFLRLAARFQSPSPRRLPQR
jgi:hypothetical protein